MNTIESLKEVESLLRDISQHFTTAPLRCGKTKIVECIEGVATARQIIECIEHLREGNGSIVAIPCDNQDFNELPNRSVRVTAAWTDWKERNYGGNTILDALQEACFEKRSILMLQPEKKEQSHES